MNLGTGSDDGRKTVSVTPVGSFGFVIDGKPVDPPGAAQYTFDGKPQTGTVTINGVVREVKDGQLIPLKEK